MTQEEIFKAFMNTIREGGLTNPNGLAAVAATGQRESGFKPENVARTWSDPSESGQPGTSGGLMSWRGPRLDALMKHRGGDMSPAAQASYFLSEDPGLINRLNNAESVEGAMKMMNDAWRFAGYNNPDSGETLARMAAARRAASSIPGTTLNSGPVASGTQMPPITGGTNVSALPATPASASPSNPVAGLLASLGGAMGGGASPGGASPLSMMKGGDILGGLKALKGTKGGEMGMGLLSSAFGGDEGGQQAPAPQTGQALAAAEASDAARMANAQSMMQTLMKKKIPGLTLGYS